MLVTVGACTEGPQVTTTVGDTEPPPPLTGTDEQAAVTAHPSTSTPSTTFEPTDLDAEPHKDPAPTSPAEETGSEGDDEEGTGETDSPGTTSGEAEGTEPDEDGEGNGSGSGGVNDPDLSGLDEHAQRSVTYVNQRRGEGGLGTLSVDPGLTTMADRWARQMIAEQDLYHNPNLGSEKPDRFGLVGENIALSHDPTNIDDMWWNSDGHRANIMGSSYTHIGVAFVRDGNGTTWAVQVFAG
jgi:uncharacterized protein YkwD